MLEVETSDASTEVGGGSALEFAEAMVAAFPPLDAGEDAVAELADVPPDSHLLEAAPRPADIDMEKLEREVERTRVIFIRGAAAIPITAILAIGGSMLVHFLLAGGFLLAIYLAVMHPGGRGDGALVNDSGGPSGGMITGEGPQGSPAIEMDVKDILRHATLPPTAPPPTLPTITETSVNPRQFAAASLEASSADPAMIGVPSRSDRVADIKPVVIPPRPKIPEPPQNTGVVVIPPADNVQHSGDVALASAGPHTQAPASPNGGMGTGGGDSERDDDTVIDLSKPGTGTGNSGGHGGGGIDHGGSGANNPEPQILEWDLPVFADSVALNPPPRSTKCKVLVLATGRAGKVEITQSCGQAGLDDQWVASLMKAKYRPAYRNGRPYDADKEVELKYGNQ